MDYDDLANDAESLSDEGSVIDLMTSPEPSYPPTPSFLKEAASSAAEEVAEPAESGHPQDAILTAQDPEDKETLSSFMRTAWKHDAAMLSTLLEGASEFECVLSTPLRPDQLSTHTGTAMIAASRDCCLKTWKELSACPLEELWLFSDTLYKPVTAGVRMAQSPIPPLLEAGCKVFHVANASEPLVFQGALQQRLDGAWKEPNAVVFTANGAEFIIEPRRLRRLSLQPGYTGSAGHLNALKDAHKAYMSIGGPGGTRFHTLPIRFAELFMAELATGSRYLPTINVALM